MAKTSKESVFTMNLGKKTAGKTALKETASTGCTGIERIVRNDLRGVTVDTEHTSGKNIFFIVSFYLLHLNVKFLPLKCHYPNNQFL